MPPAVDNDDFFAQARDLWLNGDWEGLTSLNFDALCAHPDRCRLALLVASGHLQQHAQNKARQFVKLAQDWGCDGKLVGQVLVAGAYNTMGRAAIASGQEELAIQNFEESIRVALPAAEVHVLGNHKSVREAIRLGLLPQAAKQMRNHLTEIKRAGVAEKSQIAIFETELGLLHEELSLAQQRQQIFVTGEEKKSDVGEGGIAARQEALRNKSVSQLGQDLWVLERTGYKRGGFFVEFGATDGVLLSNTWLLEKEFAWQGICAEPNPKFLEQLRRNRGCKVSDQYIGGVTGKKVEFIMADVFGGSSEYASDDIHAKRREAYKEAGHVKTVESISLHDFLTQQGAPHDIDYMSIDTEGSEYEILSAFPFDKWRVRLLTIEHNFTENREKIRKLLEANGYVRTVSQWDDWYEKAC